MKLKTSAFENDVLTLTWGDLLRLIWRGHLRQAFCSVELKRK